MQHAWQCPSPTRRYATNEGPSHCVIAQISRRPGVTFVSAQGDGTYDAVSGKWDLSSEVIEKGGGTCVSMSYHLLMPVGRLGCD